MTEHDTVDHFFNHQLYWWNKIFLLMIGRWPYQKRLWRIIVPVTLSSAPIIADSGQVIYFLEAFGEIDEMMKSLFGLAVSYVAFVLLINSFIYLDMVEEILRRITINWIPLKNEDENNIFLKHAKEGKFLILLYTGTMMITVIMYILQPFITMLFHALRPMNESLPLKHLTDVQFYIDPSKYYTPIYFVIASASNINVLLIVTFDAYFVMVVHHACGMYAILGYRIDMVGREHTKIYNKFSIDDREKFVSGKIIQCIEYHHDCIRFSKLLEKSSNISWLMQLTSNVLLISTAIVQAIIKINEPEEMLTYGFSALTAVARLFYVSFASQKILSHSVQIHQIIYNTSWYELPPKSKKLLIPMLIRASKPSVITIGKLMPIDLNTFCSLMNVSMTYLTFILSTR